MNKAGNTFSCPCLLIHGLFNKGSTPLEKTHASVMYQSISSVTIPQIFKIWQTLANFFIKCSAHGLHWDPLLTKFYTFPPLSRSQSLQYLQIRMENIYLSIENI